MNIENQQPPIPSPSTPDRRVIEYPDLVNTVQISVARTLDVEGSIDATDFESLIHHLPGNERESIRAEIGLQFDEALVRFVVGSLTGLRNHEAIILAEDREGFNGHLPWERRLLSHIALLQSKGLLAGVQLQIERYSSTNIAIEQFVGDVEIAPEVQSKQKI